MKIKVRDKKARFTLYLPLGLIKCGFIYKSFLKKCFLSGECKNNNRNIERETELTPEQIMLPKMCYSILKEYKRKHGGLNIIDVKTADGTIVEITI